MKWACSCARGLWRDETGSILVYLTLAFTTLIGVCALGAEGAWHLYTHRIVQSAADSAAYSAAAAYASDTTSDLTIQARAIAARDYNIVHGTGGATVTVNRPPSGTCYSGTSHYTGSNAVEVVVAQTRSPLFSRIWTSSDTGICGRAIALVPSVGDCLLALGTTGTGISVDSNNLSVNLTGCSLFSNSSDPNSILLDGNNNVLNAYSVGTVGGITTNGNARTGVFNPVTGAPPVSDPYASDAASWPTSATAPSAPTAPSALTCPSCSTAPNPTPSACTTGRDPQRAMTLHPGSYTNANKPNFNHCSTVTMDSGDYVFSIPAGFDTSGVDLIVGSGSRIIVTTGGLTTRNVTFNGGTNSIYIESGGFSNSGTMSFPNSGSLSVSVAGGAFNNSGTMPLGGGSVYVHDTGLTNTGTMTFSGSGANTIYVEAGGLNNDGGTIGFGSSGNATLYVEAGGLTNSGTMSFSGSGTNSILIEAGGLTNSGTMTFGSGDFTMAISGGWTSTSDLTMGSGTYSVSVTGNLTLQGSTSTLGSGIYYISGDLNITGTGGQTVTANQVTLVLTGNTSIINYTANNATFTLTAPTASGWNQGIAVWEPNSTGTNQIASGNSSIANITGVVYAPNATVNYAGNTGNTPVCTQLVVKAISFEGNTINITGDCSSVPGLKKFGQIAMSVE